MIKTTIYAVLMVLACLLVGCIALIVLLEKCLSLAVRRLLAVSGFVLSGVRHD